MNIEQVALQTYTLRDHLKTPAEIAASLKRVREIGYRAVQVSGMGPIPEAELVAILSGEGLTCCATHEPGGELLAEPERAVERLQKLGCSLTAYPYPAEVDFSSLEGVRALAAALDRAGRVLQEAGQVLTYHNHAIEFRKLEGKPILEHLYALTDPVAVQAELDTYWVQLGGADPVAWCRRMAGRQPIIHLKDCGVSAGNETVYCEIGAGNLDFAAIIREAEAGGCRWFAVEQDTCPGDPFDSIRQSFAYIAEHLVEG